MAIHGALCKQIELLFSAFLMTCHKCCLLSQLIKIAYDFLHEVALSLKSVVRVKSSSVWTVVEKDNGLMKTAGGPE